MLREGTLSAEQAARLNDSLANSPSAREVVARYTLLHAMLEMAMSTARQERAKDGPPAVSSPASPAAGCTPSGLPVIVVADPLVPIPAFSLRSPVGGWLFSYAASVLLVGAGLLITSAWKVSSGNPEVVRSRPRWPRQLRSPSRSHSWSAGFRARPDAAGAINRRHGPAQRFRWGASTAWPPG